MLVILRNTVNHFWKTKKLVEASKTLNQQPKTTENLNIIDIKSVAIEYLKTSRKLFKTIRQAKNVFEAVGATKNSTSLLHNETTKTEDFFNEENTTKMQKYRNNLVFIKIICVSIIFKLSIL